MISSTVSGSERFTRRRTGKDVFGALRVSFLDALSFCCKLHPLQVEMNSHFSFTQMFSSALHLSDVHLHVFAQGRWQGCSSG